MEKISAPVSLEETLAPAAGLFSGTTARVRTPTPPTYRGFLSEIEQMPHFGIPSEASFVRNFMKGRKGIFRAEP